MAYLLYIPFGIIPSVIWLLFYLRKDVHPESNSMILKIFFYGMLAALPAIVLEIGAAKIFSQLPLPSLHLTILNIFIGVALVEELLKYLVVKEKVLNSAEFDEPIDALLYMIIAALGFAALENILILFQLGPNLLLGQTLSISAFRFLGATFLHTLCSGIIGYFLALAIYEVKKRWKLISLGLLIGVFLHGVYNFSIMEMEENVLIPVVILFSLAIFVLSGFKRLQKMASVCKIE